MSLCWIALPPFVADDLRVCAIAAVFAHQQILFIRDNAVTALLAGALDLAAHINFAVLQQLDGLPIGQPVFQVDVEAVQQVQVVQMQIRQVERVQFRYGGSLPVRESLRPFPADARAAATQEPPKGWPCVSRQPPQADFCGQAAQQSEPQMDDVIVFPPCLFLYTS